MKMTEASAARAVLLDALGTLLELEPPGPALVAELRARLGVKVSETQAAQAMAAEIAYYRAHINDGRDGPSLRALRRACAEVLGRQLPVASGELDADALIGALLAALRFRPYPDAAPALARLRERGLRLVVVSNWDVSLPEVLERVGLLRYLDGVVTSAAVGQSKPAAKIFHRALEVAGVGAQQARHVGDTIEHDVAGAAGCGITPILIRRSRSAAPVRPASGVATISTLAELQAWV